MRTLLCSPLAALLLLTSAASPAQDMPTRVEAVRLMDLAHAASSPSHPLPNHKQDVKFRAYGLDGTTKDGTFESISGSDHEWYEIKFGTYHALTLRYPGGRAQNEYQPSPPELLEMDHLIPLLLARFDKSDVIQSITPATLFGRSAKCIDFETINGRSNQVNEICVDEANGTLVRYNVGDELIENTDFFSFEGMQLPQHIRHYLNGKLRMEVDQSFSLVEGPVDWEAMTPPNPHYFHMCGQYLRPTIQSAPQPSSAGPGPWYDVRVQGVIGSDGKVREANVFPNGRPDLEKQAVEIVSGWQFSAAICDGRPTPAIADLVVHFPPQ